MVSLWIIDITGHRCPFSWWSELARFTEDFGEAVGESIKATARNSVGQRQTPMAA